MASMARRLWRHLTRAVKQTKPGEARPSSGKEETKEERLRMLAAFKESSQIMTVGLHAHHTLAHPLANPCTFLPSLLPPEFRQLVRHDDTALRSLV